MSQNSHSAERNIMDESQSGFQQHSP